MYRQRFIRCTAVLIVLWYFFSIVGFDVHTCSHTGKSYVATFVGVKCWPVERFQDIADWIIETYNIDVHLCGGAQERAASEQLIAGSKYANRIFNHVGETSFDEWSAIVQHASLVVGRITS